MLADVLLARGAAPTPSTAEGEGYARAIAAIDDVLGTSGPSGILPTSRGSITRRASITTCGSASAQVFRTPTA